MSTTVPACILPRLDFRPSTKLVNNVATSCADLINAPCCMSISKVSSQYFGLKSQISFLTFFSFDPEYRGKFRNGKTCQGGDSVIFSQLSGARAEMIGTSCGMRSPGDLTFVADVKLDFITDSMDSMKDSSGFFAHVYSEGSADLLI